MKNTALILALITVFGLVSCTGKSGNKAETTDEITVTESETVTDDTSETTAEESETTTAETDKPSNEYGLEPVTDVEMTEIGVFGVGVTGDPDDITDDVIKKLVDNNITAVRIVFQYPFADLNGKQLSNIYVKAKNTATRLSKAGITVVGQIFWPGGMGYNSQTGKREWILHTGIPKKYADYDSDLCYQKMAEASYYIAKSMRKYVQYWIIGNEMDIETYTGPMTDAQIVRYINACADGVKLGNPNAKCGINLLGLVNAGRSLMFVNHLYGKEDSRLDWIGLDGYYGTLQAGGPETWDSYISTFYNAAKVPVVITEWSYSSADTDPLGTFTENWEGHTRNIQTQADYVAEGMKIFIKHPEVIGTLWYKLDNESGICWECGKAECRLYSDWGLFYADMTEKPALKAMSDASLLFMAKDKN